jgi:hypothetical protein
MAKQGMGFSGEHVDDLFSDRSGYSVGWGVTVGLAVGTVVCVTVGSCVDVGDCCAGVQPAKRPAIAVTFRKSRRSIGCEQGQLATFFFLFGHFPLPLFNPRHCGKSAYGLCKEVLVCGIAEYPSTDQVRCQGFSSNRYRLGLTYSKQPDRNLQFHHPMRIRRKFFLPSPDITPHKDSQNRQGATAAILRK